MDFYENNTAEPSEQSAEETGYLTGQRFHGFTPDLSAAFPRPVPQPPKAPQKSSKKIWRTVLFSVLAGALVLILILTAANNLYLRRQIVLLRQNSEENIAALRNELAANKPGSDGNSVSGTPNTNVEGMTPAQVFADNVDSVVAINCKVDTPMGQRVSSGSGFIWTEDGYIVSNYHVVEGAIGIAVVTNDGQTYEAEYIGGDSSNDIALLKIEGEKLSAVTVGRSTDLIVGDQVVAIGNALGELASSLTVGYVSAIDRIVATDGTRINMIQTDAAINSGNSGGPLFNLKGEVIGITTAKYSGSSLTGASIEGIGFAIPMADVLGMLEDLKEFGYVTGGYLGVTVTDMDKSQAATLGTPIGVLVHTVTEGSCAEKGGVLAEDIILELGGYTVGNINDLTRALREFDAGDTITVVVYRPSEKGEKILSLTLDPKPTTPEPSSVPINGSAESWFEYFFGE